MNPDQSTAGNQSSDPGQIHSRANQNDPVQDQPADDFRPAQDQPTAARPPQAPVSFGQLPGSGNPKQTKPGRQKGSIIALIGALIFTVIIVLIIF